MHRLHRLLILLIGATGTILFSSPLHSDLCEIYCDLSLGYRCDSLRTTIASHDAAAKWREKNTFEVKDLNIFQIGGKGEILLNDFFIRGEGYEGWANNGSYHEVAKYADMLRFKMNANPYQGKTKDYTLTTGHYLCYRVIKVAPTGGWTYQSQQYKIKNVRFSHTLGNSLCRLGYKNDWRGPFIGADAIVDICGFRLRTGYSYHWAKWNAKYLLNNTHDVNFTDKSHSKKAYGQVYYADVLWNFLPFIEFGVAFKWQFWNTHNGKGKVILPKMTSNLGGTQKIGRVKQTSWNSYVVSLDLGIIF